jgi:hypothetical protein
MFRAKVEPTIFTGLKPATVDLKVSMFRCCLALVS